MALGDFQTALEMRDVIQTLVRSEIDAQRPSIQYATVTAIDRPKRRCSVQLPGATTSFSVSMGSVQPSYVGQTVRLDGLLGDRFVSDVMGPAYMVTPTFDTVNAQNVNVSTDLRVQNQQVYFSGQTDNYDIIRYDDTANKYNFLADAATPTDNPNAAIGVQEVYFPNGGSQTALENARFMAAGGGVWKTSSSAIGWTERILLLGMGRGPQFSTNGHFQIDMPANGTVIDGQWGASSVTVANGMIPLNWWQTLWYMLPIGGDNTSDPTNFRIIDYDNGFDYTQYAHWFPIVFRDNDPQSPAWRTCVGERDYWRTPTLLNSWVNYDNVPNYSLPAYRKENGIVRLRGMVKGGTPGSTSVIFNLPVGFRGNQASTMLFNAISGNALGRCDIRANGDVVAYVGSTSYFSLEGITFPSDG